MVGMELIDHTNKLLSNSKKSLFHETNKTFVTSTMCAELFQIKIFCLRTSKYQNIQKLSTSRLKIYEFECFSIMRNHKATAGDYQPSPGIFHMMQIMTSSKWQAMV